MGLITRALCYKNSGIYYTQRIKEQSSYPTNEPVQNVSLRRTKDPSNHILNNSVHDNVSKAMHYQNTKTTRLEKRTGVAASVASRTASLALEPSNEGVNGEGLRELVTAG